LENIEHNDSKGLGYLRSLQIVLFKKVSEALRISQRSTRRIATLSMEEGHTYRSRVKQRRRKEGGIRGRGGEEGDIKYIYIQSEKV